LVLESNQYPLLHQKLMQASKGVKNDPKTINADLRVAPDLLVDVGVEGVAADGHDVQVVAVLAHPLFRHFTPVGDDRHASHVLEMDFGAQL
jgi:hypothetical protein